jgi:hypothetical protein
MSCKRKVIDINKFKKCFKNVYFQMEASTSYLHVDLLTVHYYAVLLSITLLKVSFQRLQK